MPLVLLIPSLLLACGPDVTRQYEAEKSRALAVATDHPAQWSPDLTLAIATPDLARVTGVAVSTAIETISRKPIRLELPLGMSGELRPNLDFRNLTIAPSDACGACFSFAADLDGKAGWSVGPASGQVPLEVAATGVLEVTIQEGHTIGAKVFRVGRITVETPSLGALNVDARGPLQQSLRDVLQARVPPIRIADLDTAALPVRDLRLHTASTGLTIDILSDVPGGTPVKAASPPASGVRLTVSEATLTGLARRAAFQAGVQQYDVAVDPRGLHLDGSTFTLDLRVWRLVGRGWWRDYKVTGAIGVDRGRIQLSPTEAKEVDASPGAGLVDPIAALLQGRILDAIVNALDRSLPGHTTENLGAVKLSAAASSVTGADNELYVVGSLVAAAPGR